MYLRTVLFLTLHFRYSIINIFSCLSSWYFPSNKCYLPQAHKQRKNKDYSHWHLPLQITIITESTPPVALCHSYGKCDRDKQEEIRKREKTKKLKPLIQQLRLPTSPDLGLGVSLTLGITLSGFRHWIIEINVIECMLNLYFLISVTFYTYRYVIPSCPFLISISQLILIS